MHWEWCLHYTSNPITKYVIKRERFVVKGMSTPLADGPFVSNIIQYKTETFPLPLEFTNEFGLHCHMPLAKRFTSRHIPQFREILKLHSLPSLTTFPWIPFAFLLVSWPGPQILLVQVLEMGESIWDKSKFFKRRRQFCKSSSVIRLFQLIKHCLPAHVRLGA